jgi:hypothetical protein
LPQELARIQALIDQGLARTKAQWPPIVAGFGYVGRIAAILRNKQELAARQVKQRLGGLLRVMERQGASSSPLGQALAHFTKITRSYWPGLFFCYEIEGLGRTNNDLEQFFGAWRWHERRATGRKSASRSEVLLGPASLASSLATRLQPLTGEDLAVVDRKRWSGLRRQIEQRRRHYQQRRAYRRHPEEFLEDLTARTIKLSLPP